MAQEISIVDTTLRDGMQTPRIQVDKEKRIALARAIMSTGVDVMEIGFPANPYDASCMPDIAQVVARESDATVCGLARLVKEDIDAVRWSLRHISYQRRRIHVFIGSSPELRSYSLGKRQDEIMERTRRWTAYATRYFDDVQYSPEDATRTEYPFLVDVLNCAVEMGARTINVPDTVGGSLPHEYAAQLSNLVRDVPGVETWSVHAHDDGGLATAVSLAGIAAGARQVEGTVLGYGERAGNADWMQVIGNVHCRDMGRHKVDTTTFYNVAHQVASLLGTTVPLNYPFVGDNAFCTESGIHHKGVKNSRSTYYWANAADFGQHDSVAIGQTSGSGVVAHALEQIGLSVPHEGLKTLTRDVVFRCAENGGISDAELASMASEYRIEDYSRNI